MSRYLVSTVLVLALALCVAPPAEAAKITLISLDGPNQGFNATRRVTPVAGNPGTTLGEQRVLAFEAAARIWERRLVSSVEIEVLASWEDLTCTPNSAVLASAGPEAVIRDFDEARHAGTWYASSIANSLAFADLDPGFADLGAVFNEALDGSEGCLGGQNWDYSIGTAPLRGIHFIDVVSHELAHGLGFASFVDDTTGEQFLGFDDTYSRNLETHSTGKTWSEMNNNERKNSALALDLHWVGGAVVGNVFNLGDGFDPDSGHVEMFYPPVLDEGSSVSHWDRDVSAKFDELMQPQNSDESAILLSQHLMQDVGWAVDFPKVHPLPDVNGNGVDEWVVARTDRVTGAISSVVVDPETGEGLVRARYTNGYAPIDLDVIPDYADTPIDEVVVLARNARLGAVQAFVTDGGSGLLLSTVGFDPQFTPIAMDVLRDFGGSPADEIAVLLFRPSDSATRVVIKDASTGALLRTMAFANGYLPIDIIRMDDFGGSPADELVVLLHRPNLGLQAVFVRDASSGTILTNQQLPADYRAQFAEVINDFGGTTAQEVAIVGRTTPSQDPEILVLDGSSGIQLSRFGFDSLMLPMGIKQVQNFAGSAADELMVFGKRQNDRATRVFVTDASTGGELHRMSLPASRTPLDAGVLPDYASTTSDEIGVLVSTATDFRLRIFVEDPQSGLRLATVNVPFDGETGGAGVPEPPEAPGFLPPAGGESPDETVAAAPLPGGIPGRPRGGFERESGRERREK